MSSGFIKYKTYSFVDKDPIIDKTRTAVNDSGMSIKEISDNSRVSTSCMNAWFNGRTKRPQFATVNAVLRAVGKTLVVSDKRK